jgi:hypothetical protein
VGFGASANLATVPPQSCPALVRAVPPALDTGVHRLIWETNLRLIRERARQASGDKLGALLEAISLVTIYDRVTKSGHGRNVFAKRVDQNDRRWESATKYALLKIAARFH